MEQVSKVIIVDFAFCLSGEPGCNCTFYTDNINYISFFKANAYIKKYR